MKKSVLIALVLISLALQACQSAGVKGEQNAVSASRARSLDDLVYKPINTDIPKTKRVVLNNGMVVHLMPYHELPLFSVASMIRVGAIFEPEDKTGLAMLTGATIRSGGTVSTPPDILDETLEFISGSVETSIGAESGSASLSVLSKDTDKGLEIFADVLRNPRFDQDRFELAKARMLDGISRQNDSPTGAANRELLKLIYKGSVYGRYPTIETVTSITIDDVKKFYAKYFVPQNVMLGVTGDYDESAIISKLEKVFKGWKGPTPRYPPVAPVVEKFDGGVYLVDKKIPQSVIRMGHLAGRKTDPDYQTLRVMDDILGGGGFSSRLVKSVRVDRGLAYSVWAYTSGGRRELGRFMAGAETKASSTAEVIGLIKSEIERIRTEPVTDEELKMAKDSIINSFIFVFDRPAKIMGQRMILDYYGYPKDYLETYRDKVMAVTKEDIMRVAAKRLHPDGLKIVIIGDPEKFDMALSKFGKVTKLKLKDYGAPRR
ncbi:peptidase, M16 family [hydrothermal vent metagenome]|uniref:Peptidase, M16 family n=1 Tax=hydrothermal vent metagenome TaxID=652676 RepID=A0A3B1CBD0_9ZZZZ